MVKKKKKNNTYTSTQVGVILEDIKSDFKVFGEALAGVKEKGDATFEAVGKLQEDMVIVKDELGLIRNELKAKVSRDEFNLLEKRVINLEKSVKAARN